MSDTPVRPGNMMQNLPNQQPVQSQQPAVQETKPAIQPTMAPTNNLVNMTNLKKSDTSKGKVVFKGFSHQLRTTNKVSVFLPVSNAEVRVCQILYNEEIGMAQTLINPSDVLMEVVKIVYNHIVEGPEILTKSFDSFLDNLVEPDLSALVYGLYVCSYGPTIKIGEVECEECKGKHVLPDLNLNQLYKETPFEGEEFAVLKHRTSLDMAEYGLPGVTFNIRIPVLRKTLESENDDIKTASITRIEKYLENVVIKNEQGQDETYTDYESLYNAVATLPPVARHRLQEVLDKDYFKYGISFEHEWKCTNVVNDDKVLGGKRKCEHVNKYIPTVEQEFFRKVYDALYGSR